MRSVGFRIRIALLSVLGNQLPVLQTKNRLSLLSEGGGFSLKGLILLNNIYMKFVLKAVELIGRRVSSKLPNALSISAFLRWHGGAS